ncbi:MAG: hypothetical protein ACYCW6_02660 [Candidatus Xenobia bacterium]
MVRGVISPFSPPPQAPRNGSTPPAPPAASGDGYAGSIGATNDVAPAPRKRRFGPVALFSALALGGAIGMGAAALAPQAAAPISVSAPVQQAPVSFTLSNPQQALPDLATPGDMDAWVNNSQQAFQAWQSGNVDKFESLTSADGLWVRGLPGQPTGADGYTHLSHQELDRDLHHKGPFDKFVFQQHGNARFVLSPDGSGQVETILLD